MNVFILLALTALQIATCFKCRRSGLDVTTPASYIQSTDFNGLREKIQGDLNGKVQEAVDLVVADVENLWQKNGFFKPSFLQNNLRQTTKKLVKDTVVAILRHLVPVFERWIADAVKPPNTGPVVYGTLVFPVLQSVFQQFNEKLKLPHQNNLWAPQPQEKSLEGLLENEQQQQQQQQDLGGEDELDLE